MQNLRNAWFIGVGLVALVLLPPELAAGLVAQGHQITVRVPEFNEIRGDRDTFDLVFADFVKGSETNVEQINYHVKANKLERNRGIVQVKVESPPQGMHLQADMGTYQKKGGNASLVETTSGYVTLGPSFTSVADRQINSGAGRVTIGTFPIHYKAVAVEPLAAKNVTVKVTVILVDV